MCGQVHAATLYVIGQAATPPAVGNSTTTFGTIDTVTGAYTQISSALSGANSVMNLTYNGTDFYVTENSTAASQNLRTLTTAGVLSSSIGTTSSRVIGGMAYRNTDGVLYAYSRTNQDYGTISTTDGSFSLLTNATAVTMANAMGGRMAMLSGVNYFVNAVVGASSAFGSFNGLTAGSTWSSIAQNSTYQNMVLASDGVKLYGLVPSTSSAATLYSINTTTGALTLETNVTASANMPTQFSGAAFAVVPEPSTIALAFSGIVVMGIGARARRKAKAAAEAAAA
jgi:hypothetical protein